MASQVIVGFANVANPVYRAYRLLQIGFIVAPLVAGLDKFFNFLVNWSQYLSPMLANTIPADTFMKVVGVVEIVAALLVYFKPRIGGYVVAAWLWAIILNLLTIGGYYDIALRDLGLSFGALALAFLSEEYGN